MENAVQALKTAAAVLIFIIAITTSFTMFSKAKITADAVITAQDRQKYLDSAEVDGGVLYTSSEEIAGGVTFQETMTTDGYRIVNMNDVISTLYRYSIEKYGITIVDTNGNVKARFDSNTENIVRQYYNIQEEEKLAEFIGKIKENTSVSGIVDTKFSYTSKTNNTLYNMYRIEVEGNTQLKCGAPWYGNDTEIAKRINADITGSDYIYNKQTYTGKNLKSLLQNKKIIEIINTIDTSEYLEDEGNKTTLQMDYQIPTVEILYIIQ